MSGEGHARRTGERGALRALAPLLKAAHGLLFAPTLLPLGPDGDRTVRRVPWVSCGVILLCFAGFQYQLLAEPGPEWRDRAHQQLGALRGYLEEHPCLVAPRDFTDGLTPELRSFLDERTRACAQDRSPSWTWEEDPELDRLVRDWRAVEKDHPVSRLLPRSIDGVDLGTLVASLFLHAGWRHLLGNLVFFWAVGPFLEDVFGRLWFALLYLASGVAGGLVAYFQDPGCTLFSLGASGAISGVMGAFLVRFATRRMRFLSIAPWLPLPYRFSVPAGVVLVFWFLQDVARARIGVPGIGWWDHIGGFVFGAAFAVVFRLRRIEENHVAPAIRRRTSWSAHPALVRANEMRAEGLYGAARRGVERVLATDPRNLDAWRERYEIALAEGQRSEAARHAARLLALYVEAGEPDLAAPFARTALTELGPDLASRFHRWARSHGTARPTPLATVSEVPGV